MMSVQMVKNAGVDDWRTMQGILLDLEDDMRNVRHKNGNAPLATLLELLDSRAVSRLPGYRVQHTQDGEKNVGIRAFMDFCRFLPAFMGRTYRLRPEVSVFSPFFESPLNLCVDIARRDGTLSLMFSDFRNMIFMVKGTDGDVLFSGTAILRAGKEPEIAGLFCL